MLLCLGFVLCLSLTYESTVSIDTNVLTFLEMYFFPHYYSGHFSVLPNLPFLFTLG